MSTILKDAQSNFGVHVDQEKLFHVYDHSRIAVVVVPTTTNGESDWHNIAIAVIEPGTSSKSHLPAGMYLLQEKGKISRFIDSKGHVHSENATTIIAKEANTNIAVGWATVTIGPKSVCISWDSPDACKQKCIRA